MILHMVLFRVAEGTPKDDLLTACDRLEALVGIVPGLRSLKAGTDVGIEGNFDMGLIAEFDDRDALRVFSEHDAHMGVATDILKFREDIAILDIEV